MASRRVPIGDASPGVQVHELDDGWTPLEVFALIKALDDDGVVCWSFRATESLNPEELLGALTVQVERLEQRVIDESSADDEP